MRHSAMIVSTFVLAMLPSAASASSLAALANGPDSLQQANKALTSLNAGISGSWYDPSKDQQGFSRFAAQWNYLVSLYNQIMKAAVESPPGGISSESVLRLWRAGFSVTSVIAQLPIGKDN